MGINLVLIEWDKLPDYMKNDSVREYYNILKEKKLSLIIKRIFDIIISVFLLILLSPVLIILAVLIKIDSKGEIFFRQERITQYGKSFKIFKFRTMVKDAEKLGTQITVNNDSRVTKIGKYLRKLRLDEIPQLLNILIGDMSFVGTRPEVKKYVDKYSDSMMATLLMPAGVTSLASIMFKDEQTLLDNCDDVDKMYVETILVKKMKYNLEYIKEFSFLYDIKLMFKTVLEVIK